MRIVDPPNHPGTGRTDAHVGLLNLQVQTADGVEHDLAAGKPLDRPFEQRFDLLLGQVVHQPFSHNQRRAICWELVQLA